MLKLFSIDQSFFNDEPVIRLLDDFKSSGLVKKAATDDRIAAYAKNIVSDPKKIYVHILAMGAGEFWGANRNADFFPESTLLEHYKSFETSPAHVFKHHINRDATIALGQVVFSLYNERMHRIELIAWIDREKGWDVVDKIEKGQFPATSMATHTPYDICGICGNKARSRSEYCKHLSQELGKIYPDGRKVMAINSGPLRFFDISIVFKPADVTSSVLQKLAYDQGASVIGSAEQADDAALQEKTASHKKLSELIKEVEGEMTGSADSLNALLDKIKDPDDDVLDFLVHYDIHHVVHAFAELGISPSVSFFAKLIGQKMCGSHAPGIEHLVAGLMKAEPESVEVDADVSGMAKSASVHPRVQITAAVCRFTKQASLYPNFAMERAFDISDFSQAPTGMIGYSGQGPNLSPDPADSYRKLKESLGHESPGLLKTLFKIAGAAIAAKWLLSKMIEAKMQEVLSQQANAQTGTKIALVKSADEAITTQKLVKADLLRSLKL